MEKDFFIPEDTQALIFDLDGTLADNMKLHFEAWKAACESFGITCNKEEMMQFAGLSTYKISAALLEKTFGRSDPDKIKELVAKKMSEFDKRRGLIKTIKEVADVVLKYYGKLPMAVGTGGLKAGAVKTLKHINMLQYFAAVVSAEDVKHHKPEPDTFLKCAELMNADPAKCLVFEDGDRGIEAAKRAGMQVIDIRETLGHNW